MMGFASATSSFVALSVNKSSRKKLKKANLTVFNLAVKKEVQNHFCLTTSVKRHKNFRWPVMGDKLRNGQKI